MWGGRPKIWNITVNMVSENVTRTGESCPRNRGEQKGQELDLEVCLVGYYFFTDFTIVNHHFAALFRAYFTV